MEGTNCSNHSTATADKLVCFMILSVVNQLTKASGMMQSSAKPAEHMADNTANLLHCCAAPPIFLLSIPGWIRLSTSSPPSALLNIRLDPPCFSPASALAPATTLPSHLKQNGGANSWWRISGANIGNDGNCLLLNAMGPQFVNTTQHTQCDVTKV